MSVTKKDALAYHAQGRPGKLEVIATKPFATQLDLSLAYTPGVAEPCRAIANDPDAVFDYTAKGNLVAVVTDGSAVLGLGNTGGLASKPVMEGKGVLFKRFADIDVFDIELNIQDPDAIVQTIQLLEPTFGGINLEDIEAPACFFIEEKLQDTLNIPVFHDDQHGTAIRVGAAFLNGVELAGKSLADLSLVFAGESPAILACARLLEALGARRERMVLCDRHGVIHKGRTEGMDPYKERFAADTDRRTLADAMRGADVFVGISSQDTVTPEMVASMAEKPLLFALATPAPEISSEAVAAVRDDAIVATSQADAPNPIHGVMGFPFVFRGALDVRATAINTEMKVAATRALAALAKEDVPDDVLVAYGKKQLAFGPDYILPKPFDPRVLYRVAPAVAQAAMDSGVARRPIKDSQAYQEHLERMLHPTREVVQRFILQARADETCRIVFPEGNHDKILRACKTIVDEGIAFPILLGDPRDIEERLEALGLDIPKDAYEIRCPWRDANIPDRYLEAYTRRRQRKGVTREGARQQLKHRINFALMMLKLGDAHGVVSGISRRYSETIKPALQLVGLEEGIKTACGMYLVLDKQGNARFFADTTVNIDPDAEALAHIAVATSDLVQRLGITPRVAMLSFSNFGTARNSESIKVQEATARAKAMRPALMIDGEMRVDVAVNPAAYLEDFPFCALKEEANVYIFPSLNAGNISYQMMQYLGGMEVVGPILIGLNKPVNALPRNCALSTIVSMTAITAVMARHGNPS